MDSGPGVNTVRSNYGSSVHRRLLALGAALGVIGWAYVDTRMSLIKIWNESETFAHGYLILPISLYIVWENRFRFRGEKLETFAFGAVLIFAVGAIWWLAKVIDVQVVQQFMFVMMCILTVSYFLGLRAAHLLAFPLMFLFLAVPFGAGLIPYMIDMTADFVVFAIRCVGIPVYRDGTYFIMPSSSWSVVSGCSGMRYLMATITVGLLFAYMNYRSLKRRIMFMVAAIAVALVANWLRAFGIVMIAHFSGMKLALGVDHYIYGWVFFGIIVFALMGIGRIWQEEPSAADIQQGQYERKSPVVGAPISIGAILGLTGVLLFWPLFFQFTLETDNDPFVTPRFNQIGSLGGWRQLESEITSWKPETVGAANEIKIAYTREGENPVEFYVAWFPVQSPGKEIINSRNRIVHEKDPDWKGYRHGVRTLSGEVGLESVHEMTLESPSQRILVWQWYWIAGANTTSNLVGKVRQAIARLTARKGGGAFIALYTLIDETDASKEKARAHLEAFARDFNSAMLPEFSRALGIKN